MEDEKISRIDNLATELGRTRAWVLNQAADRFLEHEEWFVRQVQDGISDANSGNIIARDKVMAELRRKIDKTR